MTTDFIFYLIETILVVIILSIINKGSWKSSTPDIQGRFYLRMHKAYYYIGVVGIIFGSIFAISPFFVDDSNLSFSIFMFGIFLMFLILGVICIKYYKNHFLVFDKNGVEVQSFRGLNVYANWNELSTGKFNAISGNIVITLLNRKEKISINRHLVGLTSFFEALQINTAIDPSEIKMHLN
jgi:hypothetical protein